MLVKELIEILKKQDQNQKVILSYTDHTDWLYNMDFSEDEINENYEITIGYDANDDEITEKVFMIECNEDRDVSDYD